MPKISVQAGSTGYSVNLFIQASTATDGSGKTGLAFNSAGLTAYYLRQRTTATPISLATSTVGNPWVSGGFVEQDSTHASGGYDFDIPNAVLGTGSPFATVVFQGASNMAPLWLEIELTAWNNQDAAAGGINNLMSAGTLGSVSGVRGTSTMILAAGTHVGAVIPQVQTASNLVNPALLSTGTGTGQIKLSGGYPSINWGDIANGTAANNLSATQIQSVNNLAAGSDSINTVATSGSTLTTGSTVTGTYASTAQLDGSYWQISDTTGTLDMYFEFNVGTTGVPTTSQWTGALTSALNTLKVFAFNWAGSSWDQVGTVAGTSSLIVGTQEFNFTTAHVGTGGNLGLVRLRFQNTGLTSANFYTDQVLCGYTNVQTFPTNFSSLGISAAGKINEVVLVDTVQTASNLTGPVTLSTGTHVGAVIPTVNVVQTATVNNINANAMGRFFDLDAGTFSTSSAQSVVRQIATNAGGGTPPSVGDITTAVWAKYGTGVVQLNTGTHANAVIPLVNAIQTASDGRLNNLDLNVGAVETAALAALAAAAGAATPGAAMTLTSGERTTLAQVIGTSSQAESYRASGAGGSINQMLYELIGHHGEDNIVGTTKSTLKVDHATTAMTFAITTDTNGNPTAVTRAS